MKSECAEDAILVEDLKGFGLPGMGLGVRLLLATADRFFVYPTKLREYQARYRGSFLHGGVTPEEVILPVALLPPRRAGGTPAGKGGAPRRGRSGRPFPAPRPHPFPFGPNPLARSR